VWGGRDALNSVDFIPWGFLDPFFGAVVEATEEAVVNVLVANEAMVGYGGHRTPNLPRERVVDLLRADGRIA
jgi:D-aminopeptidase